MVARGFVFAFWGGVGREGRGGEARELGMVEHAISIFLVSVFVCLWCVVMVMVLLLIQ